MYYVFSPPLIGHIQASLLLIRTSSVSKMRGNVGHAVCRRVRVCVVCAALFFGDLDIRENLGNQTSILAFSSNRVFS